jgi:RNA polymerase sigma-70 factor (ECF subfamily)
MFQLVVESTKQTRQRIINDPTERELISECQQGKFEAFKEIYRMHSTMLYSIAMRMLAVKEDAEDAMQNCFTKLYRNVGQFKGKAKFSSYLVKILMNCCYDILSRRKRSFDTVEDPLALDVQNEWSLSIEKALGLLPLKMRECFILFAVEGFKQGEIAEMMDITEGAVKAHVFQAKKKLRDILK